MKVAKRDKALWALKLLLPEHAGCLAAAALPPALHTRKEQQA